MLPGEYRSSGVRLDPKKATFELFLDNKADCRRHLKKAKRCLSGKSASSHTVCALRVRRNQILVTRLRAYAMPRPTRLRDVMSRALMYCFLFCFYGGLMNLVIVPTTLGLCLIVF